MVVNDIMITTIVNGVYTKEIIDRELWLTKKSGLSAMSGKSLNTLHRYPKELKEYAKQAFSVLGLR